METLDLLESTAMLFRGSVIQRACELELVIDLYIAQYFTKDNQKIINYLQLISPRLTFDSKREIFNFLIKKYNPEFEEQFKYHADLDKIIKQRNIFAHYVIDKSEFSIKAFEEKREVNFIKLKHGISEQGIEGHNYDAKKVDEIINGINIYVDAINKLID
jgi:hypothetical protein